jgi:hypothetical protein
MLTHRATGLQGPEYSNTQHLHMNRQLRNPATPSNSRSRAQGAAWSADLRQPGQQPSRRPTRPPRAAQALQKALGQDRRQRSVTLTTEYCNTRPIPPLFRSADPPK